MELVAEKQIDQLAALQDVDTVIKAKEDRIAELTTEVDAFTGQLERQRHEAAELGVQRDLLEARRRDLDAQLDDTAAKIKTSRMRMAQVRNERELLAMQHEINVGKEASQQIEEQLITVMEQVETVNTKLIAVREAVSGLEGRADSELKPRQEEVERLRGELVGQLERRIVVAEHMDPSLRRKYELVFQRRGRTAVVEVRDGTCLGCFMHVPPQLYNEILKTKEARQCPSCRRLLFWRADAVESNG